MTASEEKYLKGIYYLNTADRGMVSTNAIAERTDTKPASVTDMVKKLAKKGLLEHRMYQGVRLTEKGRSAALSIIRKQGLWTVFLVEKLGLSGEAVPLVAEQLENIEGAGLIEKLDAYLGFPNLTPQGKAIPSKDGEFKKTVKKLLNDLPVGAEGTCIGIKDASAAFSNFLDKNGIAIGIRIRILDKEEFDNSLGLQIGDQELRISQQIASNLYLEVGGRL